MAKILNNILFRYLRESKEELKKVTWPSQKETMRYSALVIVISIALGIYFGLADWILNIILEAYLALG
ncbi:MAG: preprotein translocase subunit SecE [Candidatus Uhrbacteria bacterium]|nr:preprotein translocase subunit SecE [Candidatus Uhrbacteria bacterium]